MGLTLMIRLVNVKLCLIIIYLTKTKIYKEYRIKKNFNSLIYLSLIKQKHSYL